MSEIAQFEKIAPYLGNPLVVVGLCLLLFFGVHRALVKAGILAKLSQRQSSAIIRLLLKHGFAVAIITIVLGFAYGLLRFQVVQKEHVQQGAISQQTGACGSNIVGNNNKADVNCPDKTAGAKTK
jgi:hypothetical protein